MVGGVFQFVERFYCSPSLCNWSWRHGWLVVLQRTVDTIKIETTTFFAGSQSLSHCLTLLEIWCLTVLKLKRGGRECYATLWKLRRAAFAETAMCECFFKKNKCENGLSQVGLLNKKSPLVGQNKWGLVLHLSRGAGDWWGRSILSISNGEHPVSG